VDGKAIRKVALAALALLAFAGLLAVLLGTAGTDDAPPPGPAARSVPPPDGPEGGPPPEIRPPDPVGETAAVPPADPAAPAPGAPPVSADHGERDSDEAFVEDARPGVAEPERDAATGEAVEVAAGRPPKREISRLVEEGLSPLRGTVELTGERKPAVEEGVPVGLSGTVTEKETGRPVAGAVVVLRSAFYTRAVWYDHHLREVARAVTDADGGFRIDRLNVDPAHFGKGGRVWLSVASDDHAPLLAIPLENVAPGYRNRLAHLKLGRGRHTVVGRVVSRYDGKPVPGGRVVATGEIDPIKFPKDQREALFLSAPETTADAEGRFVLEDVGPGRQMISVHGGDDCAGYRMIRVPADGEVVVAARPLRGRIEGKVLDGRGRPVPLVMVEGGDNSTHTFADGSFVLENFRGDAIAIAFHHTDFRPAREEGVENGTENLLVRLESRWPEVRFRVRDHRTNRPLEKIEVRLEMADGAAARLPASTWYLSKEGLHAVRIPAGAVTATVTADGRESREVELAGLRHGDVAEVVLRRE